MIKVPDVLQIRQCFVEPQLEISTEKSSELKTTAFWKDENAVKTLIYQWKQHQPLFESSCTRNDVVWAKISEELKKTNNAWQYTTKNCENKFKNITKVYKRTKDHNNQTGVEPKTCKYFKELEEVIGEKPCLKPIALASNLKKRSHLAVISKNTSSTDTTNDTDNVENSRVPIKKLKTRMERELEVWTKMVSEENRKRDEAKERRHKELLARQDKARETYEQFMTKLLDKL
ncbi:PREDICTED: uncharacterized protein LOC108779996 [Cyphomyrmex costatus]|uniref:uncharacterized protein LOC108779996 n=1 Tax=Cyphomyrmex costatus TaxID=456900 RepID=UPI000852440E|nr:PREDICTED: uncharacterized protein LOC108779996 [Cyphomyrmex costatus]